MSFTISVLVDLDDLDKLETAATTKLKAVGKFRQKKYFNYCTFSI